MDPIVLEDCLEKLLQWISEQPELPQNMDKILLVRYLKAAKFDLEKAKSLIKNSLRIRRNYPHIFTQRDPASKEMRNVIDIVQLVPMIERTPENMKVSIFRLTDNDPEKIVFNDIIKAFYMAADLRLCSTEEVWADGEIPVFDMNNVTLKHLLKINLSTMRLFMKYSQEAHPVLIEQIHIVNCNPILNRIMMIIKPFLKAEVAARIQTHLPDSDTIFNFIPKDVFPKEYGGTCGSIEDLRHKWLDVLNDQRKYLMSDENWRLNIRKQSLSFD